jgi:hypothetical protein
VPQVQQALLAQQAQVLPVLLEQQVPRAQLAQLELLGQLVVQDHKEAQVLLVRLELLEQLVVQDHKAAQVPQVLPVLQVLQDFQEIDILLPLLIY